MPAEGHLLPRGEEADVVDVRLVVAREEEGGLGVAEVGGDPLHRGVVQPVRVEDHPGGVAAATVAGREGGVPQHLGRHGGQCRPRRPRTDRVVGCLQTLLPRANAAAQVTRRAAELLEPRDAGRDGLRRAGPGRRRARATRRPAATRAGLSATRSVQALTSGSAPKAADGAEPEHVHPRPVGERVAEGRRRAEPVLLGVVVAGRLDVADSAAPKQGNPARTGCSVIDVRLPDRHPGPLLEPVRGAVDDERVVGERRPSPPSSSSRPRRAVADAAEADDVLDAAQQVELPAAEGRAPSPWSG